MDILEPNNILMDQIVMDQETWSSVAFSLGIRVQESQRPSAEAQRLASRMSKRRLLSTTQTFDYVRQFLESLAATCPGLSQESRCVYHGDAVPTQEVLKNTVRRLPIPRPMLSLGYTQGAFSRNHIELQDGIITGPDEEPYNLNHISQPMDAHFWPFFAVEVSEKSMLAAQQTNAVTAATCNNALNILATAASSDDGSPTTSFKFDASIARTFSLSIHGKEACLSLHGAQGSEPFVASRLITYRLDKVNDVASLAGRIYSIMLWSRHKRLPEITTTLDALNRRVHGTSPSPTSRESLDDDFDPACLKTLALKSSRKTAGSDRIKVAFKASLPHWLS